MRRGTDKIARHTVRFARLEKASQRVLFASRFPFFPVQIVKVPFTFIVLKLDAADPSDFTQQLPRFIERIRCAADNLSGRFDQTTTNIRSHRAQLLTKRLSVCIRFILRSHPVPAWIRLPRTNFSSQFRRHLCRELIIGFLCWRFAKQVIPCSIFISLAFRIDVCHIRQSRIVFRKRAINLNNPSAKFVFHKFSHQFTSP